MAVALRSQSVLTYASHTNPTVTAPGTIVDGDVLVLVGVTYVGSTPTPPAGFTAVTGSTAGLLINQAFGSGSEQLYGWYKIAASESGNYAITQAAGSSAYWMGSYSGADNTTPIPTFATNGASGLVTTSTTATVTVPNNSSIGLIIAGDNGDNADALTITGFTMEVNGSLVFLVADKAENSGLQSASTWTNNTKTGGGGYVTAYLVVSAAAVVTSIPDLIMAPPHR